MRSIAGAWRGRPAGKEEENHLLRKNLQLRSWMFFDQSFFNKFDRRSCNFQGLIDPFQGLIAPDFGKDRIEESQTRSENEPYLCRM
jgi:hypothetical protein